MSGCLKNKNVQLLSVATSENFKRTLLRIASIWIFSYLLLMRISVWDISGVRNSKWRKTDAKESNWILKLQDFGHGEDFLWMANLQLMNLQMTNNNSYEIIRPRDKLNNNCLITERSKHMHQNLVYVSHCIVASHNQQTRQSKLHECNSSFSVRATFRYAVTKT